MKSKAPLFVTTILLSFTPALHAAEIAKANNADALNIGSSWSLGTAPTATDVALWDSTVLAANGAALGADTTWQGLKVTNPGGLVTIGADSNVLTLGTSGIDLSAATQNLYLNGATTAVGANNQTWNIATGRYLRLGNGNLDGQLSGSATITLKGGGLVDINPTTTGASNFSGKWIIETGTTLRTTRHGQAADWDALGSNVTADAVTLSGGTLAVGGSTGSGAQGDWTWANPLTLTAGTTSTLSGQLPDTVAGVRTLNLSGAITGSGDVVFSKNQLRPMTFDLKNFGITVSGVRANILGTGNVTVNGVALRMVPGGAGAGMPFTLNNNFKLIAGTLTCFDGNDVTLKGTIALEGANTLRAHWANKDLILDGALTDGSVAGSVTFNPGASEAVNAIYLNAVNTFSGGSSFTAGRTYVTGTQGLGSGTATGNGGALYFQPTTAGITSTVTSLRTGSDIHLNNNVLVDITSGNLGMRQTGGFWIQSSTPSAIGRLTSSSGTLNIASVDANWVTTTGNLGTADHQIQGFIVDPAVGTPLAVVKSGVNQVSLTRANTYTGGSTINGGRINVNNVAALGTGMVTVNSGGQANLSVAVGSYANNFTIAGPGVPEGAPVANYGAIRFGSNTISGTVTVAAGGARIAAVGGTGTLTGALSGTGALEINSSAAGVNGALTISGDASGYTGTVTVSQGSLTLGSALGGSVAVASTATLINNGSIAGDYTHTTGIIQGTGTFKGNLTLNGTTLTDVINIVPGAMQVDGDLTLSGSTTIRASGMGGTVPVLTYSGSLTGDETSLALENASSFRSGTGFDVSTPGVISLIIVGNPITWTNNAATRQWSTAAADMNWSDGGTPGFYYQSDSVTFTDTAAGTITLVGTIAPGAITIANNVGSDYIFTGGTTGMLTGLTGITKTGDGNLTLGGINGQNYAGAIQIGGGLVTLATRDAFGKTSGITIAAGAQVELNGQNPGSVANGGYSWTIAGTGIDGPGGVGAITSTPITDLYESSGIKSLTLTGNAEIGGNGGRFDVGKHAATTTFGTITGGGFTLTKVGSNTMGLRAPATNIRYVVDAGKLFFEDYDSASGTNPITVNGGTLASYGARTFPNDLALAAATSLQNMGGGASTWSGAVTLGGTDLDSVALDAASQDIILTGTLAGAPNLTLAGGYWVTLGNTASTGFTGKWDLNGGNLLATADGSLGAVPSAVVSDSIILRNGGWLGVAAGATSVTLDANRGISLPLGDGSLVPNTDTTLTVNGPISGVGNFYKEYPGTAVLKGGSSHTGITRITGGTLVLDSGTYTGMTDLQVAANLTINAGTNVTVANRFRTSDGNAGVTIVNQTGGNITATGSTFGDNTGNSVVLGHWPAKTTYNLTGGSLNVLNVPVLLGWDGQVEFNLSGGTANLKGLFSSVRNNAAAFNLNAGGRLNIGSYGINSLGTAKAINLSGGTLGAFADWSSTKAMTLTGTTTVDTLDSADATTPRTITLTGALGGAGGLTKQGAGTLVLNNATSTFSGAVTLNGGALYLNANTTSAILAASGTTLSTGTPTAPGTVTTGSLELAGGTAAFRIGTGGDLMTAANFTVSAASSIAVVPAQALAVPSTFTVVDYTGTIGGLGKDGLSLILPNLHYSGTLTDDTENSQLKVNITAADSVIWRGTAENANWDTDTTSNWVLGSDGTTATKFYRYDVVKFDDSGLTAPNVTLVGTIEPASVSVENTTGTYTFQGSGLSGSTTLTKSGAGALVLTGTSTNIGALTINGGTLTVGNGGTSGTLAGGGNVTVASGAALAINRSDVVTVTRVLSGAGRLIQSGTGTVAVPIHQTYTGGTTVDAGVLDLTGAGGQGGTITGTVTVNTGAILRLSTGDATGWGGGADAVKFINLAGGALDVNTVVNQTLGSAVITLTGGSITGIAGTNLDFFGGASALTTLASPVTSTITGTKVNLRQTEGVVFSVAPGTTPSGVDLDVSSLVWGPNPLIKSGAGTMRLTALNTYTGNTNINGGTLDLSGTGVIYSAATKGNANSLVISGGGVLTGDRWSWGTDQTLGQLNYNPGYIAINNGTLRNVAAASTYMGGNTDSRGIAVGAGGMTLENATVDTTWTWAAGASGLSTYADNATLTLAGAGNGSFAQVISGTGVGVAKTGTGTWTLTAVHNYTGNTTVNAGTLVLADGSGIKLVIGANGVNNKVTGAGAATIEGDFTLDLSGASVASGNSWILVDTTTKTFTSNFSVIGFTETADVWTKADGLKTWTFSEATGVLSVTIPGFDSWLSGYPTLPLDERDLTDDFDKDGFNNLLEYVLGGSPLASDHTQIAPAARLDGLGNLVLTFKRSDLSETDTTQIVQYGSSLEESGWNEIPIGPSPGAGMVAISEDTPTTDVDSITVTIPTGGAAKFFARLKVSKP